MAQHSCARIERKCYEMTRIARAVAVAAIGLIGVVPFTATALASPAAPADARAASAWGVPSNWVGPYDSQGYCNYWAYADPAATSDCFYHWNDATCPPEVGCNNGGWYYTVR